VKEQVKEFWRKIDQDEVLKQKFTEAGSKEEFEGVIKDAGLAFTREEYQQAVKEMQQEAGIEKLTDDDLHKVAGGSCTPCHPQCDPMRPKGP
jgi:predicted ribosomally synthesized peptide with nif11-like leader